MATYDELKNLESDSTLQNKVEVALWIAAEKIEDENAETENHTNRLKWAKSVLRDPAGSKDDFLRFLLASERDQDQAAIAAASDAAVLARVEQAVDVFADGSN